MHLSATIESARRDRSASPCRQRWGLRSPSPTVVPSSVAPITVGGRCTEAHNTWSGTVFKCPLFPSVRLCLPPVWYIVGTSRRRRGRRRPGGEQLLGCGPHSRYGAHPSSRFGARVDGVP